MKFLVVVTKRADYIIEAESSADAYKAATNSKAKKVPFHAPEQSISVQHLGDK